MRIASVMAGPACALAMCLAIPIASAAPTDHLLFDSGPGIEMAAAPAAFEVVAITDNLELPALAVIHQVVDFAMPMLAVADDVAPVNCPTGPALGVVPLPIIGSFSEHLPRCYTNRRHDPGWRTS